jgi:hypothetical protein
MVEREARSDVSVPTRRHRAWLVGAAAVMAVALAGVWVATRSDTPDDVVVARGAEGPTTAADAATGEIRVQLEEVDGVFIEGFEVGLRFESGAGELIGSTLWSDFVASTGRTDIDSYYDSVLSQAVPQEPCA